MAGGAKYETISSFLSYRCAIQGLVLKKINFSTSSCEKTFKIKLKLLQKCLKKMQKKSKNFFLPKCPQSIVDGPEWSPSTPRVPGNSFRPSYTPKSILKNFEKSKFRPQNPFLEGWLSHKLKKRVWELHEKSNLFFNFHF